MVKNETGNRNETTTVERPARRGVFIQMNDAQHRALKVQAAQSGTTLQSLVSGLLGDALKGQHPRTRR